MIQGDFNIVFLFLGLGGWVGGGGNICNCRCFKELYLETTYTNVHFFLTIYSGAKAPLKCCMSAKFTYLLRFLSFNLLTKLAR